jgi:signal transduction histidine kinase
MPDRVENILELIRRVRHDANNPLTAALGHTQLLLSDPAITDPEIRDSLRIIESELHRLSEILRRLNQVQSGAEPS